MDSRASTFPPNLLRIVAKVAHAPTSKFSELFTIAELRKETSAVGGIFDGVDFSNEDNALIGFNFKDASLINTLWVGTAVTLINFNGANLTGAQGLTIEKLASAIIDESTILPEGISLQDINEYKMVLEKDRQPKDAIPPPRV